MILRSSAIRFERTHGVLTFEGPGRTIQSQKEEADINTIVRRFGLTGQLPQNVRTPLNIDFDAAFDYQTAMNYMVEADRAFMQMPADVRKRFGNDPAEFVNFVSDAANQDEARKLGIALPVKPIVIDEPVPVRVIVDPAPVVTK